MTKAAWWLLAVVVAAVEIGLMIWTLPRKIEGRLPLETEQPKPEPMASGLTVKDRRWRQAPGACGIRCGPPMAVQERAQGKRLERVSVMAVYVLAG